MLIYPCFSSISGKQEQFTPPMWATYPVPGQVAHFIRGCNLIYIKWTISDVPQFKRPKNSQYRVLSWVIFLSFQCLISPLQKFKSKKWGNVPRSPLHGDRANVSLVKTYPQKWGYELMSNHCDDKNKWVEYAALLMQRCFMFIQWLKQRHWEGLIHLKCDKNRLIISTYRFII